MKTQDPHESLQDGIDPSAMPPLAPDGGIQGAPMARQAPPRPRLCAAGPCRNYHRLDIQVDATAPRAMLVPIRLPAGTPGAQETPQGTVYTAPPGFHVQTHHYCYPSPGIEMPLGDLPVTRCNRWEPVVREGRGSRRFWGTPEGQRYIDEVAVWERGRRVEVAAADKVDALIENSIAMSKPKETP